MNGGSSGERDGGRRPRSVGRRPDDPTGARSRPADGMAGGRGAPPLVTPSIAADGRRHGPLVTLPQPIRHPSSLSCGRGRAARLARSVRGGRSPRRRSPGPGAARRTGRSASSGPATRRGPTAPGTGRGTPRRRRWCCAGSRPLERLRGQQLQDALARLLRATGPGRRSRRSPSITVMIGLIESIVPDRRPRAADPAAALEVLERVEGDVQVDVGLALLEDARDLRRRDALGRQLARPSGPACPCPSTPSASR